MRNTHHIGEAMENKRKRSSRNHGSAPGSTRLTRRSLLKSAAAAASATLFPSGLLRSGFAFSQTSAPTGSQAPTSPALAKNPRWYGFNLLEYFSTDADWMKYFPYKNDGMFQEDDFRWIRDWGFNWVRLPMDYRFLDRSRSLHHRRRRRSNRSTEPSGWEKNMEFM